ncbi:MAG: hypothetical protein F6J86_09260 [Symploca sp. SIO1B1]|nr:hypothetical protein [Symploca sp. SIO1B1]
MNDITPKYWILNQISALGRCKTSEHQDAKDFFDRHIYGIETDKEIVQQLWQLYQGDDAPLAEVCLRCAISHHMKKFCCQIAEQYGEKHYFTKDELLILVLEHRRFPGNREKDTSLTTRILQAFDPEKSSLAAWTNRLVKTSKEVKRFLLEHGIDQISDWRLLKETNERRLQHILAYYHRLTKAEIEQFMELIASYQTVYLAQVQANRAQINQRRKQQGRGHTTAPYIDPTTKQLQLMAQELLPKVLTPEEVRSQLKQLAGLIREFKQHQARGIATQALGGRETILAALVEEDDDEIGLLLKPFREQYASCFAKAVQEVIEAKVNYYRNKKRPKDTAFIQALELYHCQTVAMGKIAEQMGFKGQPQISRLLQEKEIRSDVARKTVAHLLPVMMELLPKNLTPTEKQQRREKLTPLLLAAVNQEMEKAKKEASVSKNRAMNSTLSRTICQYLEQREQK